MAKRRLATIVGALLLLAGASGCATPPDRSDAAAYAEFRAINDPFEPLNRQIFGFNQAFDAMALRPAAIFYRDIIPPPFQRGANNFLANLQSPVILFNDLLQLNFSAAGNTLMRFIINSTLGVAGLDDRASDFGYARRENDFGQTLAVWGVPPGPYLVLPGFGPSSPRDAAGLAVDSAVLDPLGVLGNFNSNLADLSWSRLGVSAANARSRVDAELEDLKKNSLDFYATLRSLYRQMRAAQISSDARPGGGAPEPGGGDYEPFPDIPDLPDE
ncbi:MAG: VacJ family lipoprotein [Rhodospirillales bacterium]|nr:VacJ family lipoprotein [Rhodospirillales bacterium]